MKKILFILGLLGLLLQAEGQSIVIASSPTGSAHLSAGEASEYTTQYQAILDYWTADPVDSIKGFQDELVDSLVSKGYWARTDVFWNFAVSENGNDEALTNWILPGTYDMVDGNTTTWTTLQGYIGNSTDDYLYSTFDLGTHGVNWQQNDATFFIYIYYDAGQGSDYILANGTDGTLRFRSRTTYDYASVAINSYASSSTTGHSSWDGMWAVTRRAADAVEMYHNGSSVGNLTDASAAEDGSGVEVFSRGGGSWSGHGVSMILLMDQITDAEADSINVIFERYMDHLGTGVQ
jgi:hypothetical protein